MAGENNSANMSMPVPGVGITTGPTYATDINNCLTIVDSHDHSAGKGVPVTPAGLNISSDLSFLSNNATALRSVRFTVQSALFSLAADIGAIYVNGVDLYYRDISGNNVRITASGAVAGTPGSISNLVAPASATYVPGSSTFVWQSNALTPANMDAASYIFRNLSASSFGLTLNPPTAMGADSALTLPTIPGALAFLTIDASGNIGSSTAFNGSLTTANLSPTAGIVGTQLASNIDLQGALPTANARALVVSNANAVSSLSMLRGFINASGNPVSGEGWTSARAGAGVYLITFLSSFADVPAATVSAAVTNDIAIATVSSSGVSSIVIHVTVAGVLTDNAVNFIIMGRSV